MCGHAERKNSATCVVERILYCLVAAKIFVAVMAILLSNTKLLLRGVH